MAMTFRTTDDPEYVEVYDEKGKIGHLSYVGPDDEDPTEGWVVELYGFELGGSRATGLFPTGSEAVNAARQLYGALLAYRRRMARIPGWVRVVSTPMGGQPK